MPTLTGLHDREEGGDLLEPDQLLVAPQVLRQPEMIDGEESVVGWPRQPAAAAPILLQPGDAAAQPRGGKPGIGRSPDLEIDARSKI